MYQNKPAIYFYITLLAFILLGASACSSSKQIIEADASTLQPALYLAQNPYIQVQENASDEVVKADTIAILESLYNKHQQPENKSTLVRKKIQSKLKQTSSIALALPKIVKRATQEWKPDQDKKINITWKDVLFVIILMLLMLVIGGIVHNVLNVSFAISALATILLGFLLLCAYIWYLNNY